MVEKIIFKNCNVTSTGTNVTQVFAQDNDGTAPNNEVIYRIESGAQDKFRIDAQIGIITVESGADLDREKFPHQYTLSVVAIDRGTPPNTGSAVVVVTITDINNKLPVFSPDRRNTHISEGASVGTNFFSYEATDSDETALLMYSLVDDDVEGWDETGQPYVDKDYLKVRR